MMKFLQDDDNNPEYVEMRKMLFNPYKLYTCGGVDSVIRGAMNTSVGKSDAFFTPEVSKTTINIPASQNKLNQNGH